MTAGILSVITAKGLFQAQDCASHLLPCCIFSCCNMIYASGLFKGNKEAGRHAKVATLLWYMVTLIMLHSACTC